MRYFLILSMILIKSSWAICLLSCQSPKCAHLEYYLKKCKKCTKIGTKCSKAFCQNHPQLCREGRPLKPLSIGDANIIDDQLADICLAPMFSDLNFNNNSNGDLSINNLNMVNITFFAQTKGDARKRNIGSVENILVNYLLYIEPKLQDLSEDEISEHLEQWILDTFHMTLEKANNFQLHMMVEYVRRDLYKRKGIPTQRVNEIHNKQKYTVTISKLGCHSEKAFARP
jgi:hypothetical protein